MGSQRAGASSASEFQLAGLRALSLVGLSHRRTVGVASPSAPPGAASSAGAVRSDEVLRRCAGLRALGAVRGCAGVARGRCTVAGRSRPTEPG